MENEDKQIPHMQIKIIKDGPYLVSGSIPLREKFIRYKQKNHFFSDGRELPQADNYSLCRCGKTENAPFCDGSHIKAEFIGKERASRLPYHERADVHEGPDLDLLDDQRCAYARFCHRRSGDAWSLIRMSDQEDYRGEAILAATECPSGRLVIRDKSDQIIEPELEPAIDVLQDPDEDSSAGLFVKGGITLISADGHTYEVQNRIALCRCGLSMNKPFCDASHAAHKFQDGFLEHAESDQDT